MNNQREKNYDANNYFCFINFTCEYIDLKIVPSPSIYMTYWPIVDDLWGQLIKLIQVVSTSEFHE